MKITDYPALSAVTEDNILLIDGNGGTKKILALDLILSALHLTSVKNHRMFFRGKNLGNTVTSAQLAAIQGGTFDGLWLGDYWEINGVKWRIADFDYWYNCGDSAFTNHHVVIVPDTSLYSAMMNDTSVTSGGYVGSNMYTTTLADAKTVVRNAFGDRVLTHREYLINAVTSGYPSAGSWYDSSVELMNEPMVFGSYMNVDAGSVVKRHTISKTQLALFAAAPEFISILTNYWLRDVASSSAFGCVSAYGAAHLTNAANEYGVRPVFAIG